MSIKEALAGANERERAEAIMRDLLALAEDTASYIAQHSRGVTRATPERRRLREDIEKAIGWFLEGTADPEKARAYSVLPDALVAMVREQSVITKSAPASEDSAHVAKEVDSLIKSYRSPKTADADAAMTGGDA